jgi:hypothetical protein
MLPVGFAALFIATYSVDVPWYDQWRIAQLFVRLAEGSLSFTHLFDQPSVPEIERIAAEAKAWQNEVRGVDLAPFAFPFSPTGGTGRGHQGPPGPSLARA